MDFLLVLVDVVLLLILGYTVYRYFLKGFFAALISFVGSLVAIVVSLFLATPIAELLFDVFMRGNITTRVDSSLSDSLPEQSVSALISGLTDGFPGSLAESLDGINVTDELNSVFAGEATGVTADVIVSSTVAPIMIAMTATIIFFFLVFIIKGIFGLVEKVFYSFNKIPLVGQLNNVLGGVVGILPGLINAILVFAVLVLVAIFTSNQLPVINTAALDTTISGGIFNALLSAASGFFAPQ